MVGSVAPSPRALIGDFLRTLGVAKLPKFTRLDAATKYLPSVEHPPCSADVNRDCLIKLQPEALMEETASTSKTPPDESFLDTTPYGSGKMIQSPT